MSTCLVPSDFGKVTLDTTIRITKSISLDQPLDCVYLAPKTKPVNEK